jgi:hypothetical protein
LPQQGAGAASQQLVSQHDRFAQSRASRPGFLQHGSQLSQQVGAASQQLDSQHASHLLQRTNSFSRMPFR